MLELKQFISINADEFFYVLRNSTLHEAKENGHDVTIVNDVICGFTYFKSLKGATKSDVKVKVEVVDYIPRELFSTEVKTGDGQYVIKYQVEEVEGGIIVEYIEETDFKKKTRNLNASLMTWLTQKSKKKNVENMIKSIEKYCVQDRAEIKNNVESMNQADKLIKEKVLELIAESENINGEVEL